GRDATRAERIGDGRSGRSPLADDKIRSQGEDGFEVRVDVAADLGKRRDVGWIIAVARATDEQGAATDRTYRFCRGRRKRDDTCRFLVGGDRSSFFARREHGHREKFATVQRRPYLCSFSMSAGRDTPRRRAVSL